MVLYSLVAVLVVISKMSQFRMTQAILLVLLFISSLLIISTSTKSSDEVYGGRILFGAPQIKVAILNNLSDNQDVKLHCQSKDDDLGVHVVPFNGTFEWSFRVNFWFTTLFYCQFTWRDASSTFNIYEAKRDDERCPTYCPWEVRDDAVYGFTQAEHKSDIIFPWHNPQYSDYTKRINIYEKLS